MNVFPRSSPAAIAGDGAGRPPVPSVVLGRADAVRAEVYLRFAAGCGLPPQSQQRIAGTLSGPHCRLATTLPSEAKLADLGSATGAGHGPTARAIVIEPSYWSPDVPSLYRLDLEVRDGDRTLLACRQWIGLRRLGVRGRSFWLDGRRWVPRGAAIGEAAFDPVAAHESGLAIVMVDPPVTACELADRHGVAMIAVIAMRDEPAGPCTAPDADAFVEHSQERIAAWSPHPSVVLAVLPGQVPTERVTAVAAACRKSRGTMLLGVEVDGGLPPPESSPEGVDCLVVRLGRGERPHAGWRSPPSLPLVAWRADGVAVEGRRGCDRLQSDLAAWATADGGGPPVTDWAGYVVS